jgi:hypothetical protein
MNVSELSKHLSIIGVKPAGIDFIVKSALSPPQIHLRSGPRHNITGDVATTLRTYLDESVKGKVIPRMQVASLSAEHAYIVHLQARGDVLLALNHPQDVPLCITNALGRPQRIRYTTDFIVIVPDCAWVAELKTEDGARELVKKRRIDWRQTSDGYEYVPAKEYFAELGLAHRVVLSSELPWIRTRNQQQLDRLESPRGEAADQSVRDQITRHVRSHAPCSMLQVMSACDLENAVPILHLIKDKLVHVDLDHAILSSPETRSLCATPESARNVAAALASIQSLARTDKSVSFARTGDPSHLDELGFRVAFLDGRAKEREHGKRRVPSMRTKQRWVRNHRENGVLGLNPRWANCGSNKSRFKRWHLKILIGEIRTARRATTAPSRTQVHLDYKKALETEAKKRKCSEKPASYGYFCRLWNRRRHHVGDAFSRGGRRLANASAPHRDVDKQMPVSTGPFQVAHIDHCLAPSHTVPDDQSESSGGLPWITVLVDDWKQEPIAMWITYKNPSAASDLAVIRDCARRHGRLPHAIFSDHGSDFKGTVFIGALAVLHIDGFLRPETDPRVGQPVERTFGILAEAVCRGYAGFALDIPNARSISSKKHPAKGPKRGLQNFAEHSEHLLFEVIPNLKPINGGESKLESRLRYETVYGKQGKKVVIERVAKFPPS